MAAEAWQFLCSSQHSVTDQWDRQLQEEATISESKRLWLQHLQQLGTEKVSLESGSLDSIRYEYDEEGNFWLVMERSENFPAEAPIIKSSHKPAFSFNWEPSRTLNDILTSFCDFVETFSSALYDIHSIETDICDIHDREHLKLERDPAAEFGSEVRIVVPLVFKNGMEVSIWVDWREPSSLPTSVITTKKKCSCSRRLDLWDSDLPIGDNLRVVFGCEHNYCMDRL
ncbi:hypothetical protein QR680_006877 [Steinernema hermaphroditum]|uniref:FANCL UBC-like domain-containing protein n=1 Tax=Steinernema hermaphroditum TaxID=289476 RepID=A0AA39HZC6_9BILA|nr:hypothetical protein QR680_006877 [Steinernema hermaphroditum]